MLGKSGYLLDEKITQMFVRVKIDEKITNL